MRELRIREKIVYILTEDKTYADANGQTSASVRTIAQFDSLSGAEEIKAALEAAGE